MLSAYHEAANLVVAVYNGIEVFEEVSIGNSPDGTRAGNRPNGARDRI